MKHCFSLPVVLAAFFIATLSLSSCRENTLIDSKISPSDNILGVFDTSLSVITHTYYDDTAITSLYIPGLPIYQGIGSITDAFFGTMTGATHFQVLPVNPSIHVYDGKTIDSAFLILPYTGAVYGDTADQSLTQSYQAFFMNEQVTANTISYSYTTKQIEENTPLSDPMTVNLYRLRDSLSIAGVNYHPGLRMKLNLPVLLSRLKPALEASTLAPTAPNPAFHDVFKGVSVRVTDSRLSTKAYPFFRLDGTTDYSGAGILVFYHTDATPTDTLHQRYYFNGENCGYFNKITKSYSHSPVNNLLNSIQANDSVIALQNQPGANIDVIIPGIKSLPNGLIAKAELQITLLPGYDNKYAAPVRLYPRRVSNGIYPPGTASGGIYNVVDRYPENSLSPFDILDGQLHTMTRDGVSVQSYTIGLPREVMASIAAKNDTIHLHISGTQDYYGIYRMVAGGGNHPNPVYRAKLFVVYSTLN